MSLIEKIRAKAQADVKTIVLPEGDEKRTVKAAEIIKKGGLAEPVLIGSPDAENNYDAQPIVPQKETVKARKKFSIELAPYSMVMLEYQL